MSIVVEIQQIQIEKYEIIKRTECRIQNTSFALKDKDTNGNSLFQMSSNNLSVSFQYSFFHCFSSESELCV